MWHGLQTITNYKGKSRRDLPSDVSLQDELNAFYACVEAGNTESYIRAPAVPNDYVILLSIENVSKTLSWKLPPGTPEVDLK
jgi:hypothetical protein